VSQRRRGQARQAVDEPRAAASRSVQDRLQQRFQIQALKEGKQLQLRDIVPLPKGDVRGTTSFVLVFPDRTRARPRGAAAGSAQRRLPGRAM
jgi:hypothetical protein